jgi:hypothetical protein
MQAEDDIHALWLVYCQLKEAEAIATDGYELICSARAELGRAINRLNRLLLEPNSPGLQADNLNCRQRQKGLTPDTHPPQ